MAQVDDRPGVQLLRIHFHNASLVQLLPPFPDYATKSDYLEAFAVRDQLASLFLGEHPFITRPSVPNPLIRSMQEVLCR